MSCWINASQGEDLISGPRFPSTHLQDLLQDFPGLFHWSVHIGGSSGQKQHWEGRELEKATRQIDISPPVSQGSDPGGAKPWVQKEPRTATALYFALQKRK